ncbi:hypothetical protein ACLOAU_10025 [Niabella sp. CJ426]
MKKHATQKNRQVLRIIKFKKRISQKTELFKVLYWNYYAMNFLS